MYEDARQKLESFGAYTSEGLEISYDVARACLVNQSDVC